MLQDACHVHICWEKMHAWCSQLSLRQDPKATSPQGDYLLLSSLPAGLGTQPYMKITLLPRWSVTL